MARSPCKRATGTAQTSPTQDAVPLTPPQVASLYDFPTPPNGAGQPIGLLEFGGGYQTSDIQPFDI
jgi:kumamolisin